MPSMTPSVAIAAFLETCGVEHFFGVVGHGNWALLDALANTKIRGVRARCEDHAVHMADCYWRARRTPPPAVVVASGGPGATNLVPALAEAYYSSIALVAVIGAGPSQWFDRGGIQEAYRTGPEEWVGVVKPIVKKAVLVNRPDTALEMFVRAYKDAITGRPGPVLVQIPFDIQATPIDVARIPDPAGWTRLAPPAPDPAAIDEAARLVAGARRPMVLVGTGVHNARAWSPLVRLAETFRLPVATTFAAKGAFPEDHPCYVGIPGRFGDEHGVRAARECDVLVSIGNRFTDLTTAGWTIYDIPGSTRLVQIDIDPTEIARVYPVDVGLVADARLAVVAMHEALAARGYTGDGNDGWLRAIDEWRREWREKMEPLRAKEGPPLDYAPLFDEASRAVAEVDPETSVLFDTGQLMCYAPSFFRASSRHVHTNNDHFIRMGWSVPGAIGAHLGNPEHPAIAFTGDGSFMMTGTAVATAVEYGLPVVWVVLDNRSLLFERRMDKFYGKHTFCDYRIERTGELWNPDLVAMAQSMGARALRVSRRGEVRDAIVEALGARGPVVVAVDMDIASPVYNPTAFSYPDHFSLRGLSEPGRPDRR
jgi:acetolactate synthase I/II/III large subunit